MDKNLHIIAEKGNPEISKDKLWHGALYTIVETPSGAERIRLLKSDPKDIKHHKKQ